LKYAVTNGAFLLESAIYAAIQFDLYENVRYLLDNRAPINPGVFGCIVAKNPLFEITELFLTRGYQPTDEDLDDLDKFTYKIPIDSLVWRRFLLENNFTNRKRLNDKKKALHRIQCLDDKEK
jgi:hypothetical protein